MKRNRDSNGMQDGGGSSGSSASSYDDEGIVNSTLSRSSRGRLRRTRNFIDSELNDEDEFDDDDQSDPGDHHQHHHHGLDNNMEESNSDGDEGEEDSQGYHSTPRTSGGGIDFLMGAMTDAPSISNDSRSASSDFAYHHNHRAGSSVSSSSSRSTPAKPTGRPVSFIWPVFTSEVMPWKLKKGPCNFCKDVVLYHKKSEYVLAHLKKCQPFIRHCKESGNYDLLKSVEVGATAVIRPKRHRAMEALKHHKQQQLAAIAGGVGGLPGRSIPSMADLMRFNSSSSAASATSATASAAPKHQQGVGGMLHMGSPASSPSATSTSNASASGNTSTSTSHGMSMGMGMGLNMGGMPAGYASSTGAGTGSYGMPLGSNASTSATTATAAHITTTTAAGGSRGLGSSQRMVGSAVGYMSASPNSGGYGGNAMDYGNSTSAITSSSGGPVLMDATTSAYHHMHLQQLQQQQQQQAYGNTTSMSSSSNSRRQQMSYPMGTGTSASGPGGMNNTAMGYPSTSRGTYGTNTSTSTGANIIGGRSASPYSMTQQASLNMNSMGPNNSNMGYGPSGGYNSTSNTGSTATSTTSGGMRNAPAGAGASPYGNNMYDASPNSMYGYPTSTSASSGGGNNMYMSQQQQHMLAMQQMHGAGAGANGMYGYPMGANIQYMNMYPHHPEAMMAMNSMTPMGTSTSATSSSNTGTSASGMTHHPYLTAPMHQQQQPSPYMSSANTSTSASNSMMQDARLVGANTSTKTPITTTSTTTSTTIPVTTSTSAKAFMMEPVAPPAIPIRIHNTSSSNSSSNSSNSGSSNASASASGYAMTPATGVAVSTSTSAIVPTATTATAAHPYATTSAAITTSAATTASAAEMMALARPSSSAIGGRSLVQHSFNSRAFTSTSSALVGAAFDFTVEKLNDGCLPSEVLASAISELLSSNNSTAFTSHNLPLALHYGHNYDYFASRLSQFLLRYGNRKIVSPANVFPTAGVTESVQCIATLLLKQAHFRPNGVVFTERYMDPAIAAVFTDHGLVLQSIAVDNSGCMDMNDLEAKLKSLATQSTSTGATSNNTTAYWPACVYVTPTGSYSCGATLSNAQRLKLLQLTHTYGVPVVADESLVFMDFTGELNALVRQKTYSSATSTTTTTNTTSTAAAITHIADFGFPHVLAIHSFSRLIAPSIRTGWIECPMEGFIAALKTLGTFRSAGNTSHFGSYVIAYCMGETPAQPASTSIHSKAEVCANTSPSTTSTTTSPSTITPITDGIPMSCWLHDRVVIVRKSLADKYFTFASSLVSQLGDAAPQFPIVGFTTSSSSNSIGSNSTTSSVSEGSCMDDKMSVSTSATTSSDNTYASHQSQERVFGMCIYVRLPASVTNMIPRPSNDDSYCSKLDTISAVTTSAFGSSASDRSNSIGSSGSECSHVDLYGLPSTSSSNSTSTSGEHWLVTRAMADYSINISVDCEFDAATFPCHIQTTSTTTTSTNLDTTSTSDNIATTTTTILPPPLPSDDAPTFIRLCISNYTPLELETGARLFANFLKDLLLM